MNKRGMTISRDLTRKVDKLVDVVSADMGYPLTRSQVLEGLIEGELKLHEPKEGKE